MDALPVTERVPLPFASKEKAEYNGQQVGVMHACGHDTHVAMLMGTAEVLAGMKDKIKGTVVFIFQPAEEGPPAGEEGGAPVMIREGVMDNPKIDAIFGIHINAQTEIGTIKYKYGAAMASSDWFSIKVKGKQTHGSQPWHGIDPIAVAAQIINGLQMIVSRQSELTKAPVVITVGKINGGVRENIIPEEMTMAGTIRTLDPAMQKDVHEKIRRTAVEHRRELWRDGRGEHRNENSGYLQHARAGQENAWLRWKKRQVRRMSSRTNGQPARKIFRFTGQKAPAFFFFLGGMPKGKDPKTAAAHHTPDFFIDDSRLDVG